EVLRILNLESVAIREARAGQIDRHRCGTVPIEHGDIRSSDLVAIWTDKYPCPSWTARAEYVVRIGKNVRHQGAGECIAANNSRAIHQRQRTIDHVAKIVSDRFEIGAPRAVADVVVAARMDPAW